MNYNDGSPIEPRKLLRLRKKLLQRFESLTYFPQPHQGFWTYGGVTYRDEIVVYRVIAGRVREARQFFRQLKDELKHDLRQEEILIVEKDAQVI